MSVDAPTLEPPATRALAHGRSPAARRWRRFADNRAALVSLMFLVILGVLAIAAPLVADLVGHTPDHLYRTSMLDLYGVPKGPNAHFWFGADSAGRDIFVRVVYGARVSLMVGVIATAIAVAIGVALGLVAGFLGGAIDTLLSRLSDVMLALPLLLFAIGISSACSSTPQGCVGGTLTPGLNLVIVVIAIFSWPAMFRLVRASTLSLRESTFVEAGRSVGMTSRSIMFREVLPNLLSPVVVYAALMVPESILFEAYLSFLGLGVPDATPSWGGMLSSASQFFPPAWWLVVFPGLFLLVTILAFNLVADGVRDAFDPRSTK
jgi:peptide/nickel transport system permease protein